MKKKLLALALSIFTLTSIVGCSSSSGSESTNPSTSTENKIKIGMSTDNGPIDDKAFNQGAWEGIQQASKDFNLESKYLKPNGGTESDYLKEIGNLYDAGFKFIVLPGFKFETSVYKSQDRYTDAKFVLIDGVPHSGDNTPVIKSNTMAILFAEEQAGFLGGLAAALEVKEGDFGFIGGMEIPNVQRFNWGFQQGVDYANKNYGTKITIKEDNVTYIGDFNNPSSGQQIAAQMYDKGVKVIFTAAGGSGGGAMTEAKTRGASSKVAWIIGVDTDQYADGVYEGEKSVVLTSAMKKISTTVYNIIKDELNGTFKGGEIITYDVTTDSVGLPENNPNLSEDTITKVKDVTAKLTSGEIKVSSEKGSLIK